MGTLQIHNDSELIHYLNFLISKESKDWFIVGFQIIESKLIINSAELVEDLNRHIHYHITQRKAFESIIEDDYKIWLRDTKISEINDNTFDTFTHQERIKLELLRIKTHFINNKSKIVTKDDSLAQYNNSMKEGDRIFYKNNPGIITYKHTGDELKFTINVKDTYYKYIPASKLTKRVKKDLSNIEVPKKYQEMTTEQLLNTAKKYRTFYKGRLPDILKAELDKREHIKRKPKK